MQSELFTIFLRTVVLYSSVLFMMRLMGKREIGQLSLFDLVVAIMIAELAAIPMEDTSKPLINGLLPITTLVLMEMTLAYVSLKSQKARGLVEGTPSIIIENGNVLVSEMARLRYNVDDLMTQLREKGVFNLDDVEFALLETNGKLSVLVKADKRPLTPNDLRIKPDYEGLPIPLITDGHVHTENLALVGKEQRWLESAVKAQDNCQTKDLIYAYLDSKGNLNTFKKGHKKKRP